MPAPDRGAREPARLAGIGRGLQNLVGQEDRSVPSDRARERRRAAVRRRQDKLRADLGLDGAAIVARGTCLRKERFPNEEAACEAMRDAGVIDAVTYSCPLCLRVHY